MTKTIKQLGKYLILFGLIIPIFSYSQDGSLDLTFNSLNQITNTGEIYAFSSQSNGKIIIGGKFTSINGTILNGIARLNTDGTVDSSFNSGAGIPANPPPPSINLITNAISDIAIQPDNKIIIVGQFKTFNNVIKNSIVRLNIDGSIDNSFNSGNGFTSVVPLFGTATSLQPSQVRKIKIRNDGKIVITGFFQKFNNISIKQIVILNGYVLEYC